MPRLIILALVLLLTSCAAGTKPSRSSTASERDGIPVPRTRVVTIPKDAGDADLAEAIPNLARQLLADHKGTESENDLLIRFQLKLAAEDPHAAMATLREIGSQSPPPSPGSTPAVFVYGIYAEALRRIDDEDEEFGVAYAQAFAKAFSSLDDRNAFEIAWYLETPDFVFARRLENALLKASGVSTIDRVDAMNLVQAWLAQKIQADAAPYVPELLAADQVRRYVVDEDVLIDTPDGAKLSAIVVRPRTPKGPLPTALVFTIYVDETANLERAMAAASHGYVGVVAYARGKYLSSEEILPYEHEADDTNTVIEWISARPWSNGEVGMYGGSYEGFAAWAATKRLHPALKTIVPYAAAIPGQGLPMTNNVFLNANYGWVFFVANNRTLDHETYGDQARWEALNRNWYASGRPYREIDQVDGTPNPFLQRWLQHPAYDAYWQAMVPFGKDFANIDIPVLSVTGYYDDGQISALHYHSEHYRHRSDAEHYLVIGPYDHFGVSSVRKATELRGYRVDPVAQLNTRALTFEWLDYILRSGERPALLRDNMNYQVMGANRWRHAPTVASMAGETLRLYLAPEPEGAFHRLSPGPPALPVALTQVVDLADRTMDHDDYYPYPNPIRGREADFPTGLVFVSKPFEGPVEVSGMFSGRLTITINKRDVDLGVVLYELLPDGTLFHLSYYLGRASYAEQPAERRLLEPGEVTDIHFDFGKLISRRLDSGSRLLAVVDVNKNFWHQINYGTGKDVSDESIADAGEPLQVHWHNSSFIEIPISREQ